MEHKLEYSYQNVQLKPLAPENIEMLRIWRNSTKNNYYLSKKPYISIKMQQEWYRSYLSDNDTMLFAIYEKKDLNRFVGCLGLHGFEKGSCIFGKLLVGDKDAHRRKVGLNATIAASKIAFELLGTKEIDLFVYPDNIPAITVYKQAGFKIKNVHNDISGREELTMSLKQEREQYAQHE